MFFPFSKPANLLDETSILWMFDAFSWALENFNTVDFLNETVLVTPSNTHFPGKEKSAEGMANLILDRVKVYAGMQDWPFQLVDENNIANTPPVDIQLEMPVQTRVGMMPDSVDLSESFIVVYSQNQLRDPEVLIANFAHTLAHYLSTTAIEPPPGGEENWHHVTELLAVFMGFGVIMANSANTTKIRSCGSCSGPAVERENFLSEYDITYALAIFCCLKGIDIRNSMKHLKPSLRSFFKKATKDVMHRKTQFQQVKKLVPALASE